MADSKNWLEKALHKAQERVKEIGPETGAELKRLGVHGSIELANALWNGSAFVPYGPGAYPQAPEPSQAPDSPQPDNQPKPPQQPERGGLGR